MHDTTGVRQVLHQQARTTGVVEVNVCQEYVVDVGDVKVVLLQRTEQQRDAVINPGVDERRATLLDDQVAGILQRTRVLGIDGDDAIVEHCCPGVQLLSGRRFEAVE